MIASPGARVAQADEQREGSEHGAAFKHRRDVAATCRYSLGDAGRDVSNLVE